MMQAKIAVLAAKYLLSYVRKHPQDLDELAKLIPGKVDDKVLHLIKSLILL